MHTRTEIDEIKRRRPLAAEVERCGIDLRPSGHTLLGRCPFHADRDHPNFTVYPAADAAEDSFFCFACGASGDVVTFVRRMEGLTFTDAAARLSDSDVRPAVKPAFRRRPLKRRPPRNAAERVCLMAAVELYGNQLAASPEALAYLVGRGIDQATAERCHVGYARGGELAAYLRWRRLPAGAARRVGLLDRDGRETMAGRIVIPEFRTGRAVWLTGRAIEDGIEPKYLGLPGNKPLLGWESAAGGSAVILVEGPMDWLTLRSWNLPAIALCGTHASARALDALSRFHWLYAVLDNDEQGHKAGQALADRLGPRVVPVSLPTGIKDVNELSAVPDAAGLFRDTLRAAHLVHVAHVRSTDPAAAKRLGVAA